MNVPHDYFERWNYAGRRLGPLSMYWWARRWYAGLLRAHAPARPAGTGPRRLLEVGCGLGDLVAALQDDFDCTAVDVLEPALAATATKAPRAEVRRLSGDDLDVLLGRDEGTYDVVVSLHVFEHLARPDRAIDVVARLLAPGGLFLFATPNPEYRLRRRKDPATDAIGRDPTHVNVHPPATWLRWCADAGLVVERHAGDGLYDVPYVRFVPSAVQLAVLAVPSVVQLLTRSTLLPPSMGVDQILLARRPHR